MSATTEPVKSYRHFYIDGEWTQPSSDATVTVTDSATEEPFLQVPLAQPDDMERAIRAARRAFDEGPWPRMSHTERAGCLRKLATGVRERADEFARTWARETGVLAGIAGQIAPMAERSLNGYADLADTFPFTEPGLQSMWGGYSMIVREPVGVVGAIYPWNGALEYLVHKAAPALLAGCTIVMKSPTQAPGEAYIFTELLHEIGLPAGVFNLVTADRVVGEQLVTDPRVDKITFTGSTAAGRRIGVLGADRIARVTLELGGKSAAVILDDADIQSAAQSLAGIECFQSGQVCASLTRIIVPRARHDEMVDAIADFFKQVKVGSPFDPASGMGPLVSASQRERVEGYIAKGIDGGAELAAGGGRPAGLDRGWFVEPTVFANVDNSSTIAQEEIFGPVLSVIPADDERDAVRLANDSKYGLNAAVFTRDADRALAAARELRCGTVGHNGFKPDFGIAFGGFKESGIGREGVREGIRSYLETKTVVLDEKPAGI
jgi:aldehyde dehydrogenase (NAD+)